MLIPVELLNCDIIHPARTDNFTILTGQVLHRYPYKPVEAPDKRELLKRDKPTLIGVLGVYAEPNR